MRFKTIFVMATILFSSETAQWNCHNLLYYSYYSQHIIERLAVYRRSPDWVTWFVLMSWIWVTLGSCLAWGCSICAEPPRSAAAKETPRIISLGEHPSGCSSGCFMRFPLLQLLPRVPAAPIIGGMRLFSLQQLAVAASRSGGSIFPLWAFFVQVSAPAP
jgi:hypothetical protein